MAIPTDLEASSSSSDDDDRVGEAVELYLLATEQGQPPALDEFVARYPGIQEDIRAALEGLELVHGLIGMGSATGSGTGRRTGLDYRIESGRRIAGYRVVRELGRGGMGTVYEAMHVGLDRPVALKVLGVHAAPDSSARRRFLNEARTAAGLHHTHIVPVFDVGQVGGLCYYAMQRIEGSGLDRVLKHLRRTRQVASGVGEAISGSRLPSSLETGRAPGPSQTPRPSRLLGGLTASWRPGRNKSASSVEPDPKNAPTRTDGSRSPALRDGLAAACGSTARASRSPNGGEVGAGPLGVAIAPLPGLCATAPDRDRQAGEVPPFDPPRGPAYFRWAAQVALESADALAHAHHHGVIHRDVKPSNLLIDAKGSIWVTDFGLARRLADPGITHHDSLLGTPRYMSPEQARTGTIDGRTDVYSLGATLYELLTLRPPFDGQTAAELIDQIGQQEPTAPTKLDRRVPRDLETIALKALAKRPADRYASAFELYEDLGRFLNRDPVKARRIGPIGRIWRITRRHPGITAVSTAAAAIILAIATFAYLRVVSERNHAVLARVKTSAALEREKQANVKERAARKEQLRSTIEVVALSGRPNRRNKGLELIKEAAGLDPDAEDRSELRDWAIKFLVLREIEARTPELVTGKAHGMVFTPAGHRLAVLSEDEDELVFWDVEQRRQLMRLPLRGGAGAMPRLVPEPAPGEPATTGKSESTGGGANGSIAVSTGLRSGQAPGAPVPAGRPNLPWLPRERLAQVGPYVAMVLPDDKGLGLIDLLSGSPLRMLIPPNHVIMGVLGESSGSRLVTIELAPDDATMQGLLDGMSAPELLPFRAEIQVNLWDSDHLDRPIATLPWRERSMRRDAYPLVAISPDGKTVASAPQGGMVVKLYSARDGKPLRRSEIDAQAALSALALGPNDTLATAGNTSGGVAIRIWDLDSPAFPISLTPPAQSYTRLMRFSPRGSLLAIVGSGPIELWDPVAHTLVAVLVMSDQATEVAFAPDGKTLAAVGRAGEAVVWTVDDSAARTQLSGFDSPPGSLAFSNEGVLAGVGWNGDIWSWRSGRCPEIGTATPVAAPATATPVTAAEPKRADPAGADGARQGGPSRGREGARPMRRGPMSSQATIAFDASGRMVLHDAQGLRVYPAGSISAETPRALRIAPTPAPGSAPWRTATAMARTSDGQMLVLSRSSAIYLWHAENPKELIPLALPARLNAEPPSLANNSIRRPPPGNTEFAGPQFRPVQISPRGDRVYTIERRPGTPGVLRVWAIEAIPGSISPRVRELDLSVAISEDVTNPGLRPDNLALRSDGKVLATADRTGQVTLLDTSSLAVLGRLNRPDGETENFWPPALAFSPDGSELAVGSQQGTIALWSVSHTGRSHLRLQLPGHRGRVTSLAYEPHGRRLASATFDSIVEVWDLDIIDRELVRLKLAD